MSVTINLRTFVAFATGLAVALVAVFVFQAWRVDAAPGDTDTTFVPITPCRLIDTRPAPFRVGPHASFGVDHTKTIAARGSNGNCTGIPTAAVGLSLNATAVDATQATFLTVWPDGTRPTVSSLNPAPGQPPTPNAVTTKLSGSGSFKVYNKAGSVDMIIDISGYYTSAGLDNLQAQIDQNHVFRAKATSAGAKSGTGKFTVAKHGTGLYSVNFDLTGRDIPENKDFTTVVNARCAGHIATVSGSGAGISGGFYSFYAPSIHLTDADGLFADCAFSLMMIVDEPNPPIIIVPL